MDEDINSFQKLESITIPVKTKVIYYRENLLQSVLADIFSFGSLIGLMFLNFLYWGGHWYVTIFIMAIWLIFVSGKAMAKRREFTSLDNAIAALEAEKRK